MTDSLPVHTHFSLRDHNTFGVDASAAAYIGVTSANILPRLKQVPALSAMPRLVLGGGSNLLLTRDFPGLVLHMRERGRTVVGEDDKFIHVRAAAGESWHDFVQWTLAQGFGGLENLSLIPGSVGASPVQNIGAYGAEIREVFHELRAYDFDSGKIFCLDRAACAFAYRDSVFKHRLRERAAILDVTFALPKAWQPNLQYAELAQEVARRGLAEPGPRDIAEAVIAIRSRKLPDPARIGNAGSFFKNPLVSAQQRNDLLERFPALVSYPQPDGGFKLAAGWLIDQCGWKGRRLGNAGVYEKQALVLVNLGGATGVEIERLARAVQADVQARFGVALEPEPVFI